MNYYDSLEFKGKIKEYDRDIFSYCDLDLPTEIKIIDSDYKVLYFYYKEEDSGLNAGRGGSICHLYKNDKLVFEWKSLYHNSRISNIIEHSNGHKYLIFTEDLYGYSVLELDTLKNMHYLPKEDPLVESFIWGSDIFYNKNNDLLVVEGCFWGWPVSAIVLDFSKPLEAVDAKDWIDVRSKFNENYDDITFKSWHEEKIEFLFNDKKSIMFDIKSIFID